MEENIRKYCYDILEAIEHIETFIAPLGSLSDYEENLLIKRAVLKTRNINAPKSDLISFMCAHA